jgi:hypothetical protein
MKEERQKNGRKIQQKFLNVRCVVVKIFDHYIHADLHVHADLHANPHTHLHTNQLTQIQSVFVFVSMSMTTTTLTTQALIFLPSILALLVANIYGENDCVQTDPLITFHQWLNLFGWTSMFLLTVQVILAIFRKWYILAWCNFFFCLFYLIEEILGLVVFTRSATNCIGTLFGNWSLLVLISVGLYVVGHFIWIFTYEVFDRVGDRDRAGDHVVGTAEPTLMHIYTDTDTPSPHATTSTHATMTPSPSASTPRHSPLLDPSPRSNQPPPPDAFLHSSFIQFT